MKKSNNRHYVLSLEAAAKEAGFVNPHRVIKAAKELGLELSTNAMYKYWYGCRMVPESQNIEKLAQVIGTPVNDLFKLELREF